MSGSTQELADRILAFLGEAPAHFEDILIRFADVKYRDLLRAWGKLREDDRLGREVGTGKYVPKTG